MLATAAGWCAGPGIALAQTAEVDAPVSRPAPAFTYRELTSRLPPPSPVPANADAGADRGETSALSLPARSRSPLSDAPPAPGPAGLMGRFGEAVAAEPARAGLTVIPSERERPRDAEARPIGSGRASWYQHPGKTASGEPFDPNRLTAAHHSLPFGTKVKVVNKRNGRSVVVEITDRTNERTKTKRDYAIDLSRASARKIGLDGIGQVALYRVD